MNEHDIKKRIIQSAEHDVPDLKHRILTHVKHHKQTHQPWYKKLAFNIKSFRYASAILLLLIVSVFSIQYLTTQTTTASTVHIDINPSLRIDLDADDNIIEIYTLNTDAESLLLTIGAYENTDFYTFLDALIDEAINQNFINEDNPYIMVDIDHENTNKRDHMLSEIQSRIPEQASNRVSNIGMIHGNAQRPSNEEENQADEHNMSVMRYRTIESILEITDVYTFEDLKELTTGELMRLLNNLTNDTPGGPPDNMPGPHK